MTTALEVLDAHVHVWELARRPQPWIDPVTMEVLHRDHLLPTLVDEMAAAGVAGAVLVQVLNDPGETDDYVALGSQPGIRAVVPWVDLLDPRLEDRLDELASCPGGECVVGVRHQALAEPDPSDWLCRAGASGAFATLGRRGLACDLMLRPEHLDTAHEVVSAHPGTTFVLDHAGKPPIAEGWGSSAARTWEARTRALGALPSLVCKLSGLATMADLERWTVTDLQPYVAHLLEVFGPERLLFGSDWPVSLRAGDYARTVDTARELVGDLTPEEQAAVLSGTARRVYRLR